MSSDTQMQPHTQRHLVFELLLFLAAPTSFCVKRWANVEGADSPILLLMTVWWYCEHRGGKFLFLGHWYLIKRTGLSGASSCCKGWRKLQTSFQWKKKNVTFTAGILNAQKNNIFLRDKNANCWKMSTNLRVVYSLIIILAIVPLAISFFKVHQQNVSSPSRITQTGTIKVE